MGTMHITVIIITVFLGRAAAWHMDCKGSPKFFARELSKQENSGFKFYGTRPNMNTLQECASLCFKTLFCRTAIYDAAKKTCSIAYSTNVQCSEREGRFKEFKSSTNIVLFECVECDGEVVMISGPGTQGSQSKSSNKKSGGSTGPGGPGTGKSPSGPSSPSRSRGSNPYGSLSPSSRGSGKPSKPTGSGRSSKPSGSGGSSRPSGSGGSGGSLGPSGSGGSGGSLGPSGSGGSGGSLGPSGSGGSGGSLGPSGAGGSSGPSRSGGSSGPGGSGGSSRPSGSGGSQEPSGSGGSGGSSGPSRSGGSGGSSRPTGSGGSGGSSGPSGYGGSSRPTGSGGSSKPTGSGGSSEPSGSGGSSRKSGSDGSSGPSGSGGSSNPNGNPSSRSSKPSGWSSKPSGSGSSSESPKRSSGLLTGPGGWPRARPRSSGLTRGANPYSGTPNRLSSASKIQSNSNKNKSGSGSSDEDNSASQVHRTRSPGGPSTSWGGSPSGSASPSSRSPGSSSPSPSAGSPGDRNGSPSSNNPYGSVASSSSSPSSRGSKSSGSGASSGSGSPSSSSPGSGSNSNSKKPERATHSTGYGALERSAAKPKPLTEHSAAKSSGKPGSKSPDPYEEKPSQTGNRFRTNSGDSKPTRSIWNPLGSSSSGSASKSGSRFSTKTKQPSSGSSVFVSETEGVPAASSSSIIPGKDKATNSPGSVSGSKTKTSTSPSNLSPSPSPSPSSSSIGSINPGYGRGKSIGSVGRNRFSTKSSTNKNATPGSPKEGSNRFSSKSSPGTNAETVSPKVASNRYKSPGSTASGSGSNSAESSEKPSSANRFSTKSKNQGTAGRSSVSNRFRTNNAGASSKPYGLGATPTARKASPDGKPGSEVKEKSENVYNVIFGPSTPEKGGSDLSSGSDGAKSGHPVSVNKKTSNPYDSISAAKSSRNSGGSTPNSKPKTSSSESKTSSSGSTYGSTNDKDDDDRSNAKKSPSTSTQSKKAAGAGGGSAYGGLKTEAGAGRRGQSKSPKETPSARGTSRESLSSFWGGGSTGSSARSVSGKRSPASEVQVNDNDVDGGNSQSIVYIPPSSGRRGGSVGRSAYAGFDNRQAGDLLRTVGTLPEKSGTITGKEEREVEANKFNVVETGLEIVRGGFRKRNHKRPRTSTKATGFRSLSDRFRSSGSKWGPTKRTDRWSSGNTRTTYNSVDRADSFPNKNSNENILGVVNDLFGHHYGDDGACFEEFSRKVLIDAAFAVERDVSLTECQCLCASSWLSDRYDRNCNSIQYYPDRRSCFLNVVDHNEGSYKLSNLLTNEGSYYTFPCKKSELKITEFVLKQCDGHIPPLDRDNEVSNDIADNLSLDSERLLITEDIEIKPQHLIIGLAADMEFVRSMRECQCLCITAKASHRYTFDCKSAMYWSHNGECILNLDNRLNRPELFREETHGMHVTYLGFADEAKPRLIDQCEDEGLLKIQTSSEIEDNAVIPNLPLADPYTSRDKKLSMQDNPEDCFHSIPSFILQGEASAIINDINVDRCKCHCAQSQHIYAFKCNSIQFYEPRTCLLNKASRHSVPGRFRKTTDSSNHVYMDFLCAEEDLNTHYTEQMCDAADDIITPRPAVSGKMTAEGHVMVKLPVEAPLDLGNLPRKKGLSSILLQDFIQKNIVQGKPVESTVAFNDESSEARETEPATTKRYRTRITTERVTTDPPTVLPTQNQIQGEEVRSGLIQFRESTSTTTSTQAPTQATTWTRVPRPTTTTRKTTVTNKPTTIKTTSTTTRRPTTTPTTTRKPTTRKPQNLDSGVFKIGGLSIFGGGDGPSSNPFLFEGRDLIKPQIDEELEDSEESSEFDSFLKDIDFDSSPEDEDEPSSTSAPSSTTTADPNATPPPGRTITKTNLTDIDPSIRGPCRYSAFYESEFKGNRLLDRIIVSSPLKCFLWCAHRKCSSVNLIQFVNKFRYCELYQDADYMYPQSRLKVRNTESVYFEGVQCQTS